MLPTPGRLLAKAVTALVAAAIAGCGASANGGPAGSGGHILVVAAENFWGSIAAQLGGDHVTVTNIISNPDTDPHAYEATPQDSRTVAQAQYLIVNGAGYDPWAPKLADANPAPDRKLLNIAALAGRKEGDNPHMWYSPPIVTTVIAQIISDYTSINPADAAYFDGRKAAFTSTALKHYNDLRSAISSTYSGIPVGATESIFIDLAADLGLNLVTPREYMRAISEGSDPTAQDKATFDMQISTRQIKVLAYNKQNSTPDIQALVTRAGQAGIPVVAITETLAPASATFQDWQSGQLQALQAALARGLSAT